MANNDDIRAAMEATHASPSPPTGLGALHEAAVSTCLRTCTIGSRSHALGSRPEGGRN
jgi:hypothetical protein